MIVFVPCGPEVSGVRLTQEPCVCRYGHFSGINRKVQLTYLRNGQPKASSEEEGTARETQELSDC